MNVLRNRLGISLLVLALGACTVFEPVDECPPEECVLALKFRFDHNMAFADAFPSSVKSVAVWVFDTDGKLVTTRTDRGAALASRDELGNGNYLMLLDGLPEGTYDLVAWCGLEEGDAFSVADASTKTELEAYLSRRQDAPGNAFRQSDLNDLFHGTLEDVQVKTMRVSERRIYTLDLIRDTHRFVVVLENVNGNALHPEDFDITITDENGYLSWDNLPLSDETITYWPWTMKAGTVDDGTKATPAVNIVIAELATSRLYIDKAVRPVLRVHDISRGRTVLSIDLMNYLMMVRLEQYADMDAQEYLDRQYDYNLTLFMEESSSWYIASSILINGWKYVFNPDVTL